MESNGLGEDARLATELLHNQHQLASAHKGLEQEDLPAAEAFLGNESVFADWNHMSGFGAGQLRGG